MVERSKHGERGQALALFALLATGLMLFTSLALDAGNVYLQKRRVQNAADAAARTALFRLVTQDYSGTAAAAYSTAHNNGVPGTGATNVTVEFSADGATFGSATPTSATRYVRVVADNPSFSTLLLGLVGQNTLGASAKAAAGLYTTTVTSWTDNLLPMAVPDTAPANCKLWGASNQCNDTAPSGGGTLGSSYKGLLDYSDCENDEGNECDGYEEPTEYGSKPANIAGWTNNGCDCTITTGNVIEMDTGNLGSNMGTPLQNKCNAQGLSDGGGAYGLFVVSVYNQVIDGDKVQISGYAQYKIYCSNIGSSSASGSFVSLLAAGGTVGAIAPVGYTGPVVVGMTE